jgi:hypothetical protein
MSRGESCKLGKVSRLGGLDESWQVGLGKVSWDESSRPGWAGES